MQQDETLAGSNNLEGDCMKKITNFDSNNDIPSEMTTHCACFTTPIDARNIYLCFKYSRATADPGVRLVFTHGFT